MDWILILPGTCLLLLGIVFVTVPAKHINWFYGYRTPRSMRSQEAWNDSNRLAARLMVVVGILSLNTGVTCMVFSRHFQVALAIVAIVTGVLCVAMVVVTEWYLAKAFDPQGRPRPDALREHKKA